MNKNNSFIIRFVFSLFLLSSFNCTSMKSHEPEVKLSAISSLERIGQDEQVFGESHAIIKAAKNEYESFQLVIGAQTKGVQVVNVEVSDLKGDAGTIEKNNITLFRPEYVRVRRSTYRAQLPPGLYTDPLVPFINPETGKPIKPFKGKRDENGKLQPAGHPIYALPFTVWKGQNQPIWIDVYVPKDAVSGEYTGTITVTLDDFPYPYSDKSVQNKVLSFPISLTVWDFTLPDKPTHKNHFGGLGNIAERFNVKPNSDDYKEIEIEYCKMYSDHRLSPPIPRRFLPIMNSDGTLNIIPERHNALMEFINDLDVADFQVPRAPISWPLDTTISDFDRGRLINYYRDYYNYLKENGWSERAYVYLPDEPNTISQYQRVLDMGILIKEAAPELKRLVTEQTWTSFPEWGTLDEGVDIWCPLFGNIDRGSIDEVLSKGDEVWSYTALAQRSNVNHPNYEKVKGFDNLYWHIDDLLISHRTPTWMNYQYGITGLLYWSLNTKVIDEWNLPVFNHLSSGAHFNGAGFFLYPGVPCGINGPISSIRLKNLRESMEDYEYLHIYENLAGRDAVLKIVSKIAPNWWSTSTDPKEIFSAREAIAREIVKLSE